jgi:aspartate carbamoyltransferase catalytic subunit
MAARNMGMDVYRLPENSSLEKGESIVDTIKTIEFMGFDCLVIRCDFNLDHFLRDHPEIKIPIINAGDDTNQHPTQALADYYVISRHLEPNDNGCIAFVGDMRHSRVFNSLFPICTETGMKVLTVGGDSTGVNPMTMDEAVEEADFVYMLRPQVERWLEEYFRVNTTPLFLEKHIRKTYLMHPGPITGEVAELAKYGLNSLVGKQIEAGVKIREAAFRYVLR